MVQYLEELESSQEVIDVAPQRLQRRIGLLLPHAGDLTCQHAVSNLLQLRGHHNKTLRQHNMESSTHWSAVQQTVTGMNGNENGDLTHMEQNIAEWICMHLPVPSHSYPWSWAGITANNITILKQIQHIYTEHTLMALRMLTRLLRTVEVSLLKRTISCTSTVFILWRGTHSRACVCTHALYEVICVHLIYAYRQTVTTNHPTW